MLSGSAPRAKAGRPVPVARSRRRPGSWLFDFYGSAIGKKAVMAVTGIIGLGFVFGHMVGNLKLYTGDTAAGIPHIDEYGHWLRTIGEPALPHSGFLWIMRAVLILAIVLHVHAAYSLTRMNQAARPVKYQGGRSYAAADYAARTMRWSGVIVLLFLAYHLADLTWGFANPDFEQGAVKHNMIESFKAGYPAAIYIVANLALGLHIYHGAWSLFQSLGWANPRFNPWRRYFAIAFAAVIVIGNLSFPIAVLTGAVEE